MKRIKIPAILAGYQFRLVIERLYEDAQKKHGFGTQRQVVATRKNIVSLIRKGLTLPETEESENPNHYTSQPTVKVELLKDGVVVDFLILGSAILSGFIGKGCYFWWIKWREEIGFFALSPKKGEELKRNIFREEQKNAYKQAVDEVRKKLAADIAFLRERAKEEIEMLKEYYVF